MKKKLLFVIPNLGAGGAEKSLVNLLNTIDRKYYSVDLFLFSQTGLFLTQLPEFVKILPHSKEFQTFQQPLLKSVLRFIKKSQFSLAFSRLRFAQMQLSIANTSVAEQRSWTYKSKAIAALPNDYDAAIGFLEKSSLYFIADKVSANKKIGFIHTYYSKMQADKIIDHKFFGKLDHLVAVSEQCAEDLRMQFPQYISKISVIHNIVSSKLIKKLATEKIEKLVPNAIISIGRLVKLKGFDLAVEAARILKEKGVDFKWYIIGEGEERAALQNLIDKYNLKKQVHLLGMKENPYPYIKSAFIFVQPSRYEGKSISVDEAKILLKPILLTNFTTAKGQIQHLYDGLICEMSASAVAENILKYIEDPDFTRKIIQNLRYNEFGTEGEIEKLYYLIDG